MKQINPMEAPTGKLAFALWAWKWVSQVTMELFLDAIQTVYPNCTATHLRMFYVGACALGLFMLNTPLLPTWAQLIGLLPLGAGLLMLLLVFPFTTEK